MITTTRGEFPAVQVMETYTSYVRNDGTTSAAEWNFLSWSEDQSHEMSLTQEVAQRLWRTGKLHEPSWLIDDYSLPDLIDQKRKEMICKAVNSLSDGITPLSIRWFEAFDTLQASKNLLRAILIMLGVSEEKINQIDLWSKSSVCKNHEKYVTGIFTDDDFSPPSERDTNARMMQNHILSLCNQTRGPEENSFLSPLIDLLGQYGNYARDHKTSVLQQKEKEGSTTTQEAQPSPEEEHLSSQEVTALRREIKDLRSQIDEITALMKQLLLNQKKE
jgi:hypothetical protein